MPNPSMTLSGHCSEDWSLQTTGIVGLGHVGLAMAMHIAARAAVIGLDSNTGRVESLQNGRSYIDYLEDSCIQQNADRFEATTDPSRLNECRVILVTVPTPLDEFQNPDLSCLFSAIDDICKHAAKGTLVCIESSVWPGCCQEKLAPRLQAAGIQVCSAPERFNPGGLGVAEIPRIVGADDPATLELAASYYRFHFPKVSLLEDTRSAEMVKMLENSYRLVNISFINEMALLCGKLDINIHEVIQAAAEKPFGYHPFYPGPGAGGHCIPLDPVYLNHAADGVHFRLSSITTALDINNLMPHRCVVKINSALNSIGRSLAGSSLVFFGVTYKADVGDLRESAVVKVMEECIRKKASVSYHDPLVSDIELADARRTDQVSSSHDCSILAVAHSGLPWREIIDNAGLVVDLCGISKKLGIQSDKIFCL
jgi:UDP-N-acetyl-D-glucosamine dehydrogenase